MMNQYIVLQNIAPDQGPIIYPSATADDPPTLIDESVIRGDSEPLLVYQNNEPTVRVAATED